MQQPQNDRVVVMADGPALAEFRLEEDVPRRVSRNELLFRNGTVLFLCTTCNQIS